MTGPEREEGRGRTWHSVAWGHTTTHRETERKREIGKEMGGQRRQNKEEDKCLGTKRMTQSDGETVGLMNYL